jgi:hypothetical protein
MDSDNSTATIDPQTAATVAEVPLLPPPPPVKKKAKTWPIIVGALVLLALVIGFVILMMSTGSESVGKIRDIFIIFMALESLIIGIVLVILIVQLAVLINLIQNEIKPILQATNETVATLKGTTTFISDNLAEPVIKVNATLAGLKKFMEVLFPARK